MPPACPAKHEPRSRVEALDLLRFFAVMTVLLFHYGYRGAAADGLTTIGLPGIETVTQYGYLGVELFFVISGFVIAYSTEGRTASGFAIARIARIYPGFLFCMTATCLAAFAIGAPRFETSAAHWFANLFVVAPAFKQPFMDGAYWSIVYEITFYGWVFLLMSLWLFRRRIDWIILIWLGVSMLDQTLLHWPALRRLFLTDESGFFAAGVMLYEIFRGRRDWVVMMLLALATVTAANQVIMNSAWHFEHYHVALNKPVLAAVAVAAVALVALVMNVRKLPIPAGVVIAIGGITYPMYLLHQHIGYMAFNRLAGLASPAVLIAAMTLAVLTASLLVWRYVERPAQKWTKRMLTDGILQVADWTCSIEARMPAAIRRIAVRSIGLER
jgi:peptidoglycan/LPS O-acetylase OafA/YrhL